MIEILVSVLLLLLIAIAYKFIIRPKRLYNFYLKNLESRGYKIYKEFKPFGIILLNQIMEDKKKGDPLKICKTLYRDYDVILGNSISKIALDFSHPDFIKDFYSNEHLYTYPKQKFMTEPIARAMGRGIPFSEGQEWKRKRKIINAVFNFQFIKSMVGKIQFLCTKAINDVEEKAIHFNQNGQHIVEYDVIDLTARMFSSVVLECFLGGATDQILEGKPICLFMNQLIAQVTESSFQLLPLLLGSKFVQAGLRAKDRQCNRKIAVYKEWGRKFIHKKVQQTKQRIKNDPNNKEPIDIIEALLRATSQNKNEDPYTQQQILQEFSTFFIAGTDTTSHYVMTMIYYLAQNPEVEKRLREQIDKYMKDDDYSYQNLKKLIYIDWIQKQTTRMYGPVNGLFMRVAKQDNYLNGLPIKKGTYVNIQHMGNHYSDKYFKDPLVFRPQRWENQCNQIPPFVLGGFSAGARTCIGKHLVAIESKIGLIKFMKRYKKITIPGPLKWDLKFVYTPQYFKSKLTINEEAKV